MQLMADYSAGFRQGLISSSNYDHNLVSFQSEASHSSSEIATGFASISDGDRDSGGMSLSGNPSAGNNMSAFSSPSTSSSSNVLTGLMPKYKHVTASPACWSPYELAILKEGLIRHAHEPNIMKYIKIAAMLPTRTVRDVALRCWWNAQNEDFGKRRNPEERYAGRKLTDTKMVASTSTCNNHLASPSDVAPFSLTRYHSSQKVEVTNEVPVLDSVTRHLLDENERLLIQIASNLELFKIQENMDPFLRTSSNILAILSRMSQTPGIMCRMPPLPISLNEEHLNSLIQFSRWAVPYGAPSNSHLEQEPTCCWPRPTSCNYAVSSVDAARKWELHPLHMNFSEEDPITAAVVTTLTLTEECSPS